MLVTHEIKMNLTESAPVPIIRTVQGDAGSRVLCLDLRSGSQDEPWPIPQQVRVLLRYRRADGAAGFCDTLPDGSRLWTAEENRLLLHLPPHLLAVPGLAQLQAVLQEGDALLTTFRIGLDVQGDLGGDPVAQEDYVNWPAWARQALADASVAEDLGEFYDSTHNTALEACWDTLASGGCKTVRLQIPFADMFLPELGVGSWLVRLSRMDEANGAMIALGSNGSLALRRRNGGVWLQWEWHIGLGCSGPGNAPEMLTGQRWVNAPVYVQEVYMGKVGNQEFRMPHGIAARQILRCIGLTSSGDALPYDNGYRKLELEADPVYLTYRPSGDLIGMEDFTVTARIWFLK